MMETKHFTYVETEAVEAVLRVVQVLRDAGDEAGALRELEHFVAGLKDRVLVPLERVVEEARAALNPIPWLVRSNPERFQLN